MRADPNTGRAPRPDAGPVQTEVELTWLEGRIEHWIRFGHDCGETILDRRRRILRFAPESVFAFVRWASNDFGTIVSRIDILRAIDCGESYQTLPFVRPGGKILLRISGWPKVVGRAEAIGLMQIMPQTWADLRSRYGLGANLFDPHDNILAGAAYLHELHDRYGAAGFLAAYNAGPGRYEDLLASGRPLPLETQAYVAALAPMLREDGSAPGTFVAAIIRSWTSSPLFPVRANDASSTGVASSGDHGKCRSMARPAADWTGLAPQSEGLFAPLSVREPRL